MKKEISRQQRKEGFRRTASRFLSKAMTQGILIVLVLVRFGVCVGTFLLLTKQVYNNEG